MPYPTTGRRPVAGGGVEKRLGKGAANNYSTHTPIERLLARLDGVSEKGRGRWMACCPAHDDRAPSLSIREKEDGRLLVHCFACCPIGDVLAAVGLATSDLYPGRDCRDMGSGPLPPGERWVPRDVLQAVSKEALIVLFAASDTLHGIPLSESDMQRLAIAHSRLLAAVQEAAR